MSTRKWQGDAVDIAQVDTITIALTWATNDTATISINGKDLILTVGATVTTTAIATAIKEMINGDTITGDATRNTTGDNIEEFAELTATVNGSVVTVTADTKGVPFTMTATENTAGSGTATRAASVAVAGPALFDDPDNWSASTVPVDNDTVDMENSDRDLIYNLSQSGIGLTTFNIKQSYEGHIGLPTWNANGYYEYRPDYLSIGDAAIATTINIGQGEGNGSERIKINQNTAQTTLNIFNTGSPAEDGVPAVLFLGTHASNVANVMRGSVGFAVFSGETTTIATLRIGSEDGTTGDTFVVCGSGVTLTTVVQNGGSFTSSCAITTVTINAGTWLAYAGAVTTINARNCTIIWNSSATIATYNGDSDSVLDAEQDERAFTITNCTLKKGATIKNRKRRITFTNGIILSGCSLEDVTLDLGDAITITVVYN